VRSRSAAALSKVAAICGLLVVPALASAQLRCPDDGSAPKIRRVRFEGNESFLGSELQLHIYATPTDLTAQYLGKRTIAYGAALGAGIGLIARNEDKWKGGVVGGLVGGFAALVLGSASGIQRCLRPGLLVGDMSSILGFYGERGFPDARVDTTTVIDGEWVDITFRIKEGLPVLIDSVSIPLDSLLADLGPKLNSQVGKRYSPLLLQQDLDSIQTRLHNSGYPEGVALQQVSLPTRYRAIVGISIVRGPRAHIGRVSIDQQGIEGRRPRVDSQSIRELLLFAPGDLYNERALFESERRFYRVGSFLATDVASDVSHLTQDSLVDVTVHVTEDLSRERNFEPGIGTLDCLRTRIGYSDRAFRGGLNRLDVSASVSKVGRARPWPVLNDVLCRWQQDSAPDISSREINYNATIRFTRPTPLRGGLLPSVSAYTERRGGYQAYLRTTIVGGALTLTKSITRNIVWDGTYTLEYGQTKASAPVLCFVFRACEDSTRKQLTKGNTPLDIVGMRFARDRRDFADSASRGTFARLDLRASDPLISDKSLIFQKVTADGGWYHQLGRTVLALRLRGGAVTGGQTSAAGRLPPPEERLYAGGETTVRGFSQNELGPLIYVTDADLDTTFVNALPKEQREDSLQARRVRTIPVGGNAMIVGNVELRFPSLFLRSLKPILFVDVGALSTEGFGTIGEKQARWTPGIALRYFSPIGPVQFNLGYNNYDYVDGPVYLNQGPVAEEQQSLKCLSGTLAGVCQPLRAKEPKSTFWKRLTFTIAFPPDF
jgi:outer membrane protein insertion porin family/translocation and assembly module TamA